jgi:hypothetical protein
VVFSPGGPAPRARGDEVGVAFDPASVILLPR